MSALAAIAWSGVAIAQTEVVIGEREPLGVMLITPKPDVANTKISELFRLVSRALEANTAFEPQFIEDQQLAAACEGRRGCLVSKVRSDFVREAWLERDSNARPYADFAKRQRPAAYPRLLVVLSNIAREGRPDYLSAVLIDTDVALEIWHEADRRNEAWRRDVESQINSSAIKAVRGGRPVEDAKAAETYIESLFNEGFKKAFEEAGAWQPYGSIVLTLENGEDVAVRLDDQTKTTAGRGQVILRKVRHGSRRLGLANPRYKPFEVEVEVPRNGEVSVSASLDLRTIGVFRSGLRWGGAALAGVGVSILTVALVNQSKSGTPNCLLPPPEPTAEKTSTQLADEMCGPGREFLTFAADRGENTNPPGVMQAPLGYSLAGTGLVFFGGSFLDEDQIEFAPWYALGSGIVIGVVSYVLSAVLNGKSPHNAPGNAQ